MENFFSQHQSPICLVAHNGNGFDYPVLRSEIIKTHAVLHDMLCIDSLIAFQHLLPKDKPITDTVDADFSKAYNELESSLRNRVCEIQKNNETTPKRQMISMHQIPQKRVKLFHSSYSNR